jgi:5-(carboxyamino)imidazole ribonucleotide synthase
MCKSFPVTTDSLPTDNNVATIGIVGGGQLGRMLALAAAELGLKSHIYCPEEDCPAAQVASALTAAAYDDSAALATFAAAVDVVTYEFENIPVATVEHIAVSKNVFPSAKALKIAQDRFEEKSFMRAQGFGVADFFDITDLASLETALAQCGGEGILKTRRFGYDGKGQWRLDADSDLADVCAALDGQAAILEALVPFEREVSILVARGQDGATACYDVIENVHRNHILHSSTLPAQLPAALHAAAKNMAEKLATALDYVGVLAIECFVVGDSLLINEIAPRVHNSGHLTQDACHVGQFEQHMRAVAGWPLGDATAHSDAVMTNLLGDEIAQWRGFAAKNATHVHLYGKAEARAGRKMGHVTRLSPKNS